MATTPFVTRIGGVIPWFFFDVIGRIVPGAYLIAMVTWGTHDLFKLKTLINNSERNVVDFATSFLLLLIASYFLGFVLGPISWFLEKLFWRSPWTVEELREWYGLPLKEPSPIEHCIKTHLGFTILEKTECPKKQDQRLRLRIVNWFRQFFKIRDQNLRSASRLCQFFVYDASYQLGLLSTRWDAEALAARNTMAASLVALILSLILTPHLYHPVFRGIYFAFVSVGIYFLSALVYDYHRKKALMGKFDLFLACVRQRFGPTTPTPGE